MTYGAANIMCFMPQGSPEQYPDMPFAVDLRPFWLVRAEREVAKACGVEDGRPQTSLTWAAALRRQRATTMTWPWCMEPEELFGLLY